MTYETLPPLEGGGMAINQGFDVIRFITPVKTGSRIRTRFVLAETQDTAVRLGARQLRPDHRDRERGEAGAHRTLADGDRTERAIAITVATASGRAGR